MFQFELFDEDGSRCSETLSDHHFERDLPRYIPILFLLLHEVLHDTFMCVLTTSESARMNVILHGSMVRNSIQQEYALVTDTRNDYIY